MTYQFAADEFWSELVFQPQPVQEETAFSQRVAAQFGQGQEWGMELLPGVFVAAFDYEFWDNLAIATPEHPHLIQFMILLSGSCDSNALHPLITHQRGYLSGSGISPGYLERKRPGERLTGVDINLSPLLFRHLLIDEMGQGGDVVKTFIRDEEWKTSFYPDVTPAMRSLAQQILHPPFEGTLKRIYLQGKVFELLALMMEPILRDRAAPPPNLHLKPDTIARLHHARNILLNRLDNPPSLIELATEVGISDRTLRRGFQELFGTTVMNFLMGQQMQRAKELLQQRDRTVAEVARTVGYGHLGRFAATFKKQFGISPRECLMGKQPTVLF